MKVKVNLILYTHAKHHAINWIQYYKWNNNEIRMQGFKQMLYIYHVKHILLWT